MTMTRQERYRQRQQETGKRELRVWVTDEEADAIRALLTGRQQPSPPQSEIISRLDRLAELVEQKSAAPLATSIDLEAPVQLVATFLKKPSVEDREILKKQRWMWNGEAWTIVTPVRSSISTALMMSTCMGSWPVINVAPCPK